MPARAAEPPPGRLLLLDGHSLAYRAFFALPVESFSTSTGQPTNAVYGFTAMLINVLRDERPTHVAVAFDLSAPTFRHESYAEYKATRAETPADFRGQVSLIREVLEAMSVPAVSVEGFEADDVIATLATQGEAAGFDVLVVTGDRDAFQLVSDRVTVLMTRRGISDMVRFTPAAVQEKYGLTPRQYPDFAALRGDPSDNLPSVPGIGEKTATRLIREFGSLAGLVDHVDQVGGKVGESLRAHLSEVLRNRQLTELSRDVPLPVGLADLAVRPPRLEEVHRLFDTLQFRTLRERLLAELHPSHPGQTDQPAPSGAGFEVELAEAAPGRLADWLRQQAGGGTRIGLAVRGRWGRGTGEVDALALAGPSGPAACVVPAELNAEDDAALAAWLRDPGVPKAIHDLKGPLLALRARGLDLAGVTSDTALAAYLALPGQRSFDLADLTARYLGRELHAPSARGAGGQLALDTGEDRLGLAVQARAVAELADALEADLAERQATRLLADLELPLVGVLAGMEQAGIAVDAAALQRLSDELAAEVAHAAELAHASVGHDFNLGSPKQLQVVLFEELGLPKTKRIKTGYTTDADAIAWLASRSDHPLLGHLLRHRDVTRLKTVVDGLLPLVDDGGRVHTTFNQTVAATGRLSSQDPNLQNIPVRTAEGRRIRQAFVVGAGYECLVTADYAQIEMRILAHLCGDPELLAAFRSGEDVHTTTAARVFDVPAGEVTPEMRRRIKAMSYGLAYGLSAFGLAQQLQIGPEEARAQMQAYFDRFGGVRDYLHGVVEQARARGYTETVLGRRRYLPDLTSDNAQRRQMAERMALNAPVQGSAADIIKVAMLGVDRALRAGGLGSRLLLQVHDELVVEVAPGERAEVEELLRREMTGAYPLSVPLEVSVGVGTNWDEAAH